MSSMHQFFVRKVTDDAITAIRAKFPSAEIDTNSEFLRVLNTTLQEQDLMDLSLRLETDVMWLHCHKSVDTFEYYHWQTGVLLRALVYGCVEERTWERVEGQAEAWERQYFFDPDDLASLLDDEDFDEEDRYTEDEKQQLKQFWQAGELVVGKFVPILSAQHCAFHIARYYRFPGWDRREAVS